MNSKDSYFFSMGCDPLPFLFLFMFRLSLIWLVRAPTSWLLCLFCCCCNFIPFTYIYMHNSLSCRCVAYSVGGFSMPLPAQMSIFYGPTMVKLKCSWGEGKDLRFLIDYIFVFWTQTLLIGKGSALVMDTGNQNRLLSIPFRCLEYLK